MNNCFFNYEFMIHYFITYFFNNFMIFRALFLIKCNSEEKLTVHWK